MQNNIGKLKKNCEDKTLEAETDTVKKLQETLEKLKESEEKYACLLQKQKLLEEDFARRTKIMVQANKELEEFVNRASHDLGEPLRMVSGFLRLIAKRYTNKLDASGQEFIGYAVDGAERMQKLIDTLLKYSRVTTQGDKAKANESGAILEKAIKRLGTKIEKNAASITYDEMPLVHCNSVQLEEVFVSIIDNAIKFCRGKKPVIILRVKQRDTDWLFSIQDNGIGVPEDFIGHIFSEFKQLHKQKEYPGNGMGLYICKKILQQHNGQIWAESKTGKGTTFYFTLPKSKR